MANSYGPHFENLSQGDQLAYIQERFSLTDSQSATLLRDAESRNVISEGYNFEKCRTPMNPNISTKGMNAIENIVAELADELVPGQ